MDRVRHIFFFISFGLSFFISRGQQIGNYVTNGSFENLLDFSTPYREYKALGWSTVDSIKFSATVKNITIGNVPNTGVGYQMPQHGRGFIRITWYLVDATSTYRSNLKNRLKQRLTAGKSYCVKMYVSRQDDCPSSIDGFGFYFGDASIDTIKYNATLPLTFLTPQISNPSGNIISNAINWTPISGTFTANGNEKYLLISNFRSDAGTNTLTTGWNPTVTSIMNWGEYFVDAISCIEVNVNAYAGPDKLISLGDSTYIGRQPDYILDTSCIWFQLPNMTTAIDTGSGLWVKPSVTSTYVVRQELDCSPVKWDTVVVSFKIPVDTNDVGLYNLERLSANIKLFPNPTSGILNISFSTQTPADFNSFRIYNFLGQIMREDELHSNSAEVGTSDLAPGLYEIHFKSRFGTVTKKFVKTSD
jgi:hypothetical protein